MDVHFATRMRKLRTPEIDSDSCQLQICSAPVPVKNLTQVYKSVDLREAGLITAAQAQGGCGMCWAFGTAAAMENLILLDKENIPAFWKSQVNTGINISVIFIGTNTYGGSYYCEGGNFFHAAQYIATKFKTLETAADYPYTSEEVSLKGQIHSENGLIQPKLSASDFYLPFKMLTNETPLAQVFYSPNAYFDATARATMKSLLSRGIAVVGGMYVGGDGFFSSYNGKSYVSRRTCPIYQSDHQIVFVGYGIKDGVEVWVCKNSWGSNWGANGFFYMVMGENDWCIEHEAFALIPKYYKDTNSVLTDIGSHTRGAQNQLDPDTNQLVENTGAVNPPQKPDTYDDGLWWVWVVVAVLALLLGLVVFVVCWARKQQGRKKEYQEVHLLESQFQRVV